MTGSGGKRVLEVEAQMMGRERMTMDIPLIWTQRTSTPPYSNRDYHVYYRYTHPHRPKSPSNPLRCDIQQQHQISHPRRLVTTGKLPLWALLRWVSRTRSKTKSRSAAEIGTALLLPRSASVLPDGAFEGGASRESRSVPYLRW